MPWSIKKDNRCPASKPFGVVKKADNELEGCHTSHNKAERQIAALNASENKQMPPLNVRGLTVAGTLEAANGSKFGKPDANYVEPAPKPELTCGSCRFYLRSADSEIGACQVVAGGIAWFASCDYYIDANAEAQATFAGTNAYEPRDEDDKEAEMPEETKDAAGEKETEIFGMTVPTSFAELDELRRANEMRRDIRTLNMEFSELSHNIMMGEVDNKVAALKSLADEYGSMIEKRAAEKELATCLNCGATEFKTIGEEQACGTCGMVIGDEQEVVQFLGLQEVIEDFKNLLAEFKARPMKTEGGIRYGSVDFAYTPDKSKPSTWKLRLAEGRTGHITTKQLGRAAAAFSAGGFRGRKVQIPAGDVAQVKSRIRREYAKLGVRRGDIPDSVKARQSGFSVYKDTVTGKWRWLAVFSNKFRDRDNPPEILSEAAHKDFVRAVDAGEWPYPVIQLWHTQGTDFGVADFLTYDDRGFTVASGTVYDGKETLAEKLAEKDDLGVSHGMPIEEIKREEVDPTVLARYRSREISVLPVTRAANELTGFTAAMKDGGSDMGIPDEKREWLAALVGEESVTECLADIGKMAATAETQDLEHKEKVTEPEPTETQPEVVVGADAPKDTEPEKAQPAQPDQSQMAAEIGAAIKAVLTPVVERLGELEGAIKALQVTDEDKITDIVNETPAASMKEMIIRSVIGVDETRVRKNAALARDKPPEAEPNPVGSKMGIPFLDKMREGEDWRDGFDMERIDH